MEVLNQKKLREKFIKSGVKMIGPDVEVIPVGCRYHPIDLKRGIRSVIPSVNALEDIRNVTHEWLGMAWYWLHGRI